MKRIDIHSHILPGADDGAENLQQSLAMLKEAVDNQIEAVIVTPHCKMGRHSLSADEIRQSVKLLSKEAEKCGIFLELYPGNELFYRSSLLKLLAEKKVCTLADSDYVLIEFAPSDEFRYIRNGLYEVLLAGYYPVLAHAERYQCLLQKRERIRKLADMGCYIQVNAGSVLGDAGFLAKRYVSYLLSEKQIHFIASDTHDLAKRRIRLKECEKKLLKKVGEGYTKALLSEHPKCILENREI